MSKDKKIIYFFNCSLAGYSKQLGIHACMNNTMLIFIALFQWCVYDTLLFSKCFIMNFNLLVFNNLVILNYSIIILSNTNYLAVNLESLSLIIFSKYFWFCPINFVYNLIIFMD